MADESEFDDHSNEDPGPESLDCIEPNLWLGNLAAATDLKILESKSINSILTLDTCPLPSKISDLEFISTKFIQVTDTPKEDLLSHFEDCFCFIEESLRKGGVLVHCYFGISRSATILISYVMKKKSMDLKSAFAFVKSKRRFVGPNPGFMDQLQLYENMGCEIDKNNVQYKMYRLQIAADCVQKAKILPQFCYDVIKSDPSLISVNPDPKVFRCKKCRRVVALISNTIPHMPKARYSWKDKLWSQDIGKIKICLKTYFIEPINWMTNVTSTLEGKLYCPNASCNNKLGSFSWIKGCQCPCGTKVCPAFYLVPSKVDKGTMVQNVQVTV